MFKSQHQRTKFKVTGGKHELIDCHRDESSILQTKATNLVLLADIFFISSRAGCKNLAENSEDIVNLGVTDTRRQLLQNLCLLVRRQLNTTVSNIMVIKKISNVLYTA